MKVQVSKQGQPVDVLTVPCLRPYQRCIFGRGPDADVKLEHASLSRAHAHLAVDRNGVVTLSDLGSGTSTAIMVVSTQLGPACLQTCAHALSRSIPSSFAVLIAVNADYN
jgi:pSer/pThr/pTyr-binding forkhead associated (FHA) protein